MSEIGRVYPLGGRQGRQARVPESHRPEPRTREPRTPEPGPPEPLWREVLGRRLRALRTDRDETLAQTAERAGISPQYLSEIERGRKEASSEMIAALAGALGVSVAGLMADTAQDLRRAATMLRAVSTTAARPRQRPAGPVALASAA
jgi:transcriptional regulator with XRE-family HTH domain